MRRPSAWLGVATLSLVCAFVARADAGDPLKPYVFLIVDTSGSMDTATGYGPPSCPGSTDTRLDHAKCAIQNVSNSYGDMVLGLGRFRESTPDNNCADGCTMNGVDCTACDEATGAGCTASMSSDTRLEVLTSLVDGNNADLVRWNDFTCGTCGSTLANNPDVYIGGWTPIAGSLKGAKRYFQGLQATDGTTLWPSSSAGFDPIRNDPLKNVFLPSGAQCRPYIVISLTDGDETCTTAANANAAATSLLTTTVDARTYRIETKPIGFGQPPGYAAIEDLAHAGGAANGAGNEGFYAQNEEELQLAISQIIADAVHFELCNNLDDDCDTRIDEDFPSRGMACNDGLFGVCRGTGTYVCAANGQGTTCQITNPGQSPGTETCNNLDDDCDSFVDEGGVCNGCGTVELCNNIDDDCDTRIDEGLVRSCGTDVGECTAGTESCMAGTWQGCNATGPFTEICDGLDNDCDGVSDGLTQECTLLPVPPGNPNTGPCHPGTQVCPPNGNGMWGTCVGEVGPITEICDTIDNDCDTRIDEQTGGADCSSSCGVGTTVCMNGVIECHGTSSGGPEVCNDFDDNCNGMVDEGIPDMGPCTTGPGGEPLCMPGVLRCVGGQFVCQGGEPAQPEACDCMDNDCDSRTDEEPPALCPSGQACVNCECAPPCQGGEFPCPLGRTCQNGYCVADPCFNVVCNPLPNGDKQQCENGTCVRSCDRLSCPTGYVCVGSLGECKPDDCTTFPNRCTGDQQCVGGQCVSDPCAGVTCGTGEYCTNGTCASSCADVNCGNHQRCVMGHCEADPCGAPCPSGRVCDDDTGQCVTDPCLAHPPCASGEACNPQTGQCERDPCLGVTCPGAGEICVQGTCDDPPPGPDAGVDEYVTAAGGGGCDSAGGGMGAFVLALFALLGVTRRRRVAREEVRS